VVVGEVGDCTHYQLLRLSGQRLVALPAPYTQARWTVCGLGAAPVGRGFAQWRPNGKGKLVSFTGRSKGNSVSITVKTYRWSSGKWRRASKPRTQTATPMAALRYWGLRFPWRNT
jgi:hypothetical protein